LHIGDLHIGLRSSSHQLTEEIRDVFSAHVDDDVEAPTNYSLRMASGPKNRRSTGFHLLYRGSTIVLRSRDPKRVIQGTISQLDSHARDYTGLLRIQGMALVNDHGALAVPALLREYLPQMERRLNVRGVRVVDLPWVLADPVTREIVVPEPGLDIASAAVDRFAETHDAGREDPPVPPGRYPMLGWSFFGEGVPTRGFAVAMGARITARSPGASLQDSLDSLADIVRHVEPHHLTWDEPAALTKPILRLMEAA
jgi:hypothetical protein